MSMNCACLLNLSVSVILVLFYLVFVPWQVLRYLCTRFSPSNQEYSLILLNFYFIVLKLRTPDSSFFPFVNPHFI